MRLEYSAKLGSLRFSLRLFPYCLSRHRSNSSCLHSIPVTEMDAFNILVDTFKPLLCAQGLCVILVAITSLLYLRSRFKNQKEPPAFSGWIPWLGCAVQFGKDPLGFIEEMRQKLGPIFTLKVAGERLTFLTDPEDFSHFFQSSNVDFQLGVYDSVARVASLSRESFFTYHTKLHDLVKGKLAPSRLHQVSNHLCEQFNIQINEAFTRTDRQELHDTVIHSMYKAVMNNLFGQDVLPVSDKDKFEILKNHFIIYDEQFEMGAKLPAMFLKDWASAKSYLLQLFRPIVKQVKQKPSTGEHQTLLETMLDQIEPGCAANYGVLTLWAVLANAIPMTFWTLAYVLSDPTVAERLRKDLQTVFKDKHKDELYISDEMIQMSEEDLNKIPYLKWCVLETIRLHPVGVITRRVTTDFKVKGYDVTSGTMLMVSPFWIHRDPQLFSDPSQFKPERWAESNTEKGLFLDGFVAFGGGRYQCPGRWFALLEIQMFVALFLLKFDVTVHSDMPKPSLEHVVGTQHPISPFHVTCNRRS